MCGKVDCAHAARTQFLLDPVLRIENLSEQFIAILSIRRHLTISQTFLIEIHCHRQQAFGTEAIDCVFALKVCPTVWTVARCNHLYRSLKEKFCCYCFNEANRRKGYRE